MPVVLLALLATAQPPAAGDETDTVRRVNAAIDKGVQYLRSQHSKDKQWEGLWLNMLAGMDGGVTSLATLAMLNCGVPVDDREVASALQWLRKQPPKATYAVGLQTMVFAEARVKNDQLLVERNVDWLIKNATRRGGRIVGWTYGPDAAAGGSYDGSNTQYALLGLYAGKQAGAKIPDEVWKQVEQLYVDGLTPDGANAGFWRYSPSPLDGPSFTMTVAGVSGLLIAGMGLDASQQGLDPATGVAARCGQYGTNDPVARGLNWIGSKFAFVRPPGGKNFVFYNVYGIERVGRLSGLRFLGSKDWYREGCNELTADPSRNPSGQRADGSWTRNDGTDAIDASHVIGTSFALLFLSKGRTPVLLSKLAYGDFQSPQPGELVETGPDPRVVGWNRKHNDARHLTDFASRTLFDGKPMGWQVYDARRREFATEQAIAAEVGSLVQSPILYLTGHDKPRLTSQQKAIVKKYVEEGGFVVAEACCGSTAFGDGFHELMTELFPDTPLDTLPPEHPVWRSHFAVPPTAFPKLEGMSRGCRTVCVYSPEPLAGYWEESKYMTAGGRGGQAFQLAANVIAYATGKEPPKQRLTSTKIATPTDIDRAPPRGTVQAAQIRLPDEPPPADNAVRNLMAHLRDAARLDVTITKQLLPAGEEDLLKFRFLYLHGRKRFTFGEADLDNLRVALKSGGLLLADACCGSAAFDTAFRENVAKLFPDAKLEPIPADDELFGAKLTGTALTSVKRRDKASAAGTTDDGFRDVQPALEGVRLDGRWVVIYSKYDLGCALEGHKSSDCLGHTRDSALQIATAAVLYALKR